MPKDANINVRCHEKKKRRAAKFTESWTKAVDWLLDVMIYYEGLPNIPTKEEKHNAIQIK